MLKKLKEMMKSKGKEKVNKDQSRLESELKDIILNNIKEKIDSMLDTDKTYSKFLKKVQKP